MRMKSRVGPSADAPSLAYMQFGNRDQAKAGVCASADAPSLSYRGIRNRQQAKGSQGGHIRGCALPLITRNLKQAAGERQPGSAHPRMRPPSHAGEPETAGAVGESQGGYIRRCALPPRLKDGQSRAYFPDWEYVNNTAKRWAVTFEDGDVRLLWASDLKLIDRTRAFDTVAPAGGAGGATQEPGGDGSLDEDIEDSSEKSEGDKSQEGGAASDPDSDEDALLDRPLSSRRRKRQSLARDSEPAQGASAPVAGDATATTVPNNTSAPSTKKGRPRKRRNPPPRSEHDHGADADLVDDLEQEEHVADPTDLGVGNGTKMKFHSTEWKLNTGRVICPRLSYCI
ncbi:hypothetical protein CYMTET_31858 [Cymbomonas tetramitiformis]|uniref:Uncharacterized protein n=1 Tax=Cymbomonas tetramitiformis TaxID=36881 RepID=A0AAE0FFZ8_9CHLO|nr:hypothetical protein CYMTET_31858 [Cymbomonas tetramitiformis]